MAPPPVTLLGLATAVPPNQLEQSAVADFARRIYAKSFARYPKLADVFVNSGIERRYSVRPIEWFDAPHDWTERTRAYLDGANHVVRGGRAGRTRPGRNFCARRRCDSHGLLHRHRDAEPGSARGRADGLQIVDGAGAGFWPWLRRRRLGSCRLAHGWPARCRARSSSWSWSNYAR